jgi:TolB-like protein/DNA-binding winged helix-turn-helix (wHTH) protein
MDRTPTTVLRIGDWRFDPASGEISRGGKTARLEVRPARLLLCLAQHAGEVVSIDELLTAGWPGVAVSQDSVYQAVALLRRLLEDDPKQPTCIATVPRLGYRLIAPVSEWADADSAAAVSAELTKTATRSKWLMPAWAIGVAAIVGIALAVVHFVRVKEANARNAAAGAPAPLVQQSIAVLPFLDLSEHMAEEEFADGMTEELIDRLSKIQGLRVSSPTSVFYYKNKQIPVAVIAHDLGVAYVLDGSTRKSGSRMRIAARLIRPETGYVIWTETYDRPFNDMLDVQDNIAGEVTRALATSIQPDRASPQR